MAGGLPGLTAVVATNPGLLRRPRRRGAGGGAAVAAAVDAGATGGGGAADDAVDAGATGGGGAADAARFLPRRRRFRRGCCRSRSNARRPLVASDHAANARVYCL